MIDISPEIVTILMLSGVLIGIVLGYPIAVSIGAVALIIGFLTIGDPVFKIIYSRLYELAHNYVLAAVPMFIFMGIMIEKSGIAEKMYDALYLWLGGFRGGLAISTVLIGTIVAATVGIIGASVTMLTLIALPAMIKRGYSKSFASGVVCAGGCLGILIPPSIMLVVYGPMAVISVGRLFFAAFIPGFVLSATYCTYIAIRSLLQPSIAPAVSKEERKVPVLKKVSLLITSILPTAILIFSVLGVIFMGIAPPTEAAAVGAFVATILTICYRRFSWSILKDAVLGTFRVTVMILLIAGMSYAFVGVFLSAGGGGVVERMILDAPGGKWGAFGVIMFVVFILGFFIDWIGIVFIIVPILSPTIPVLGFDPLWFAMMICVNFQMGFMTPPFAPAIYYLRGSASPELGISSGDIIRGVIPFIGLVMVVLGLCVAFPDIILWLPHQMIEF